MKIIQKFLLAFATLVLICVLTLSIAGQASAAEIVVTGSCGDSVTYTLYSDGELVIGGSGAMQNYSYSYFEPWFDSINYSDGDIPWCDYRGSIKKVTIEFGVTTIGDYAFSDCSSLTSINIPNSVTSIGVCAFLDCYSLTELHIDDFKTWSEVELDFNPFEANDNPHKLVVGGKLVEGTFVVPNGVTQIPTCAFRNCRDITSILLPNGVTNIEESAFSGCDGLVSITIPDSVTSIGKSAFSGCDKLVSITIPNSVTSIGESAFSDCNRLVSITIPGSATSIGNYAFSDCGGLTRAVIGTGVPSIPRYLFYNCSKLTHVEIPESVADILIGAFSGTGLTDVYYRGTKARWGGTITSPKNEALYQATVHYETEMPKELIETHTHSLVHHEAVDATCTEDGNSEYWACEGENGCDKMFSDVDGIKEITKVPIISAGHNWSDWEITAEPTETEEGAYTRACSKCGASETEPIPILEYYVDYYEGEAYVFVTHDDTYAVIFASYDDDGMLLSVDVQNVWLSKDKNEPIAPKNFNADGNVKVMLWESLNSMKPLAMTGESLIVK